MPDTFGHHCVRLAREEKERAGKMDWERVAEIIDAELAAREPFALSASPQKRPPTKRVELDALFEALVTACGLSSTEMTPGARGTAGHALAGIRKATPDVTGIEIKRRAKLYRQRNPTWELTPKSLSAHWHRFSPVAPAPDIYKEPDNWRERLRAAGMPCYSKDNIEEITSRQWDDIRVLYGASILARIS